MPAVDYFGAQNRGLQALGAAFDSVREQKRRDLEEARRVREEERRNRLINQQLKMGQFQLGQLETEAERTKKNREKLAEIFSAKNKPTSTNIQDVMGQEPGEEPLSAPMQVTEPERPYTQEEKYDRTMQELLSQGNIQGAASISTIQQHQTKESVEMAKVLGDLYQKFNGNEASIKGALKMAFPNLSVKIDALQIKNTPAGPAAWAPILDPEGKPTGGYFYENIRNGTVHTFQPKTTDPKLITTKGPTGPVRSPDVAGAVPYERTPKETINPYNIYYNSEKAKGQTDEQIAKSWDAKELEKAKASRSYLAIRGIQKTGAYFDATDKKWKINTEEGTKTLTSDEVRQMNLAFGEETPTSRVRTMQQLAPKVLDLARSTRALIEAEVKNLGPIESRKRNIMADKIGMADPKFTAIETHADLLGTLLANMHVGASGAEKTIERFANMIKVKNQSPENLLANIDAIIGYAEAGKKNKYATEPQLPWAKSGATGTTGKKPLSAY